MGEGEVSRGGAETWALRWRRILGNFGGMGRDGLSYV